MNPEIFKNLEFFALLPVAILVVNSIQLIGRQAFVFAMVAVSLGFIVILPDIKLPYLASLAGVVAFIYIYLNGVIHFSKQDSKLLFALGVSLLGIYFFALKYSFWAVGPDATEAKKILSTEYLPAYGLAFMGVRIYSLIADVHAHKVKSVSALEYIAYIFWFPTFMSGPLDRYSGFCSSLNAGAGIQSSTKNCLDNLPRFIMGAFKVFVISGLLQRYTLFSVIDQAPSLPMLYFGFLTFYWYEYMNFSGYSDMAIATSRMMGIALPENFNHPYQATSVTDLWRRWHITLAGWLRDYIYYPLLFSLMRITSVSTKTGKTLLSAFAIFITFVICGVWHGESYGMLFFGISSGLVLAIETIVMAKNTGKAKASSSTKNPLDSIRQLGLQLLTMHVAMITFGPVLLTNDQFIKLIGMFF